MWKSVVAVVVSAAVVAGLAGMGAGAARQGAGEPGQPVARVRVGTYDNRAVAIAWSRSAHNDVGELYKQLEEAKAAGDRGRIKELKELGPKRQQRLHYQGFGRAPVTDLLEPVKDRLGEAARAAGVDAIVFECDFAGEGVEVVDVTDEVVRLFDPTDEALRIIEELKKHEPVPLEDLRDID